MSRFSDGQSRQDLKILLNQYQNLKEGKSNSYIEEEGFELIIDHFEQKDLYKMVLEVSEYGISQFPYSSSLLYRKANALIVSKLYKESLLVLEQAALLDSTDSMLYILKTDAYLGLDKVQDASELLKMAMTEFSGDEKLDLLFELADVHDDYENFEAVFDCFHEILNEDPSNEEALYKICFWADFTGRNEESIKLHQEIIEKVPFNELAWFNLGAAYQGLKLHEKAIDAYKYAVAINEKFDFAYRNMADAFIRIRNYKEAIEELEKVLEMASPESVLYEALGHCYSKMGDFSKARFYLEKASSLNAEDSQLYYKIACTFMNENQWESAIKQLGKATRTHRMQPEYNLALGICYKELKNIDEAITYFGNVVRVRPKNINGWQELLKCLFEADMFEEGREYADFALEQTDNKPIFYFFKSIFSFALGKFKEGLFQLENGLAENPKLIKKFTSLCPSLLEHSAVVDLITRYNKKKSGS
jgi:tetratricopeptide (TPR) repeat protein